MNTQKWNEWLAGLTDGDGCFYINKTNKTVSFELTTHVTDSRVVNDIKNKLKIGSVRMRSNCNAIRYRVKAKPAILNIIERLNGKLYHPVRVQQFIEVCALYQIQPVTSYTLPEFPNAYLAGIIDSDGTITISTSRSTAEDSQLTGAHGKITRLTNSKGYNQISLKITTSSQEYANFLANLTGFGKIYVEKANKERNSPNPKYHWTIKSQEDFQLLYNYLKTFPLKSVKMHRLRLALLYFKYIDLRYHLKPPGTLEAKIWAKFAKSWYKYSY